MTHETVGRRKDGNTFPIEIAISELTRSEGRLFIAIVRDITERKRSEEELKALHDDLERRVIKRTKELASLNQELEHQALHDALTELPNRLLLQDRMHQALLSAQREHHQLALLITDLDRFQGNKRYPRPSLWRPGITRGFGAHAYGAARIGYHRAPGRR